MIKHCAHCKHRDQAGYGPACFYEYTNDSCGVYTKERRKCRELVDGGASYLCFEAAEEYSIEDALDWLLEAFDQLEYRVGQIEDGLRAATRR